MPTKRSIILCCMGTRGDVQPFVALGLGMVERGWDVTIAAPNEFQAFVEGFGVHFADMGRSLQREMLGSAEGKALRTVGPLGLRAAARAFFNVGLFWSWFTAIAEHCRRLQPEVLLLTSFPAMTGAAIIPRLYGMPQTKVVVAHTVPMRATSEFAVPLSGTGFSARWPVLNRIQWAASAALVGKGVHAHTARQVVRRAAEELQAQYHQLLPSPSLDIGEQFGTSNLPILYIYSSHLLPKPADWPSNCHVVGPLLLRHQAQHSATAVAQNGGNATRGAPAFSAAEAGKEGAGGSCNRKVPQGNECHGRQGEQSEQLDEDSFCHPPTAPCSQEDSADFSIPASRPVAGNNADAGAPCSSHACSSKSMHSAPCSANESECRVGSGNSSSQGTQVLQPAEPAVGLPALLQGFLNAAFRQQLPVVYIGLGSMLGTVFEPEQVSSILDCIAAAVVQLSARVPMRAVIHTTLGSGRSGQLSKGVPDGAPFILLGQPVSHNLLLPQCSLVVHHGGAGTTQAALVAGKPALVVPCVPASDQKFWADLVWRRGLGPRWFPINQLSVSRLVAGMEEGLLRLDELTKNAEQMAVAMHCENGVENAITVIEQAAGASQTRPT